MTNALEITKSTTNIETQAIQINALNPENLSQFYQESIGLTLLSHTDNVFQLGIANGQVLLEIFPAQTERTPKTTGLYHMAFLLPSRKDLANIFYHLLVNEVPMTGASDHGYSEALYLDDPEGNGIEIYADKDRSQWTIEESGVISGIVEPMDSEGVIALADRQPYQGMPEGTIMGHIHLHVHDLESTLQFYHQVLGLGAKHLMGNSALFMSTNDYHHHLGANLWQGSNIPPAKDGSQGLRASVWKANAADYKQIKENLNQAQVDFQEEDQTLIFKDPAGTSLRLVQA